MAKNLLLI